jgi:uncharacterized protein (DUF1330 family)
VAKGYWIVRVDVHDAETYKQYLAANAAAFKTFSGQYLVRGGRFEAPVGASRERNVVIEFPDFETARECYESPEYQHAIHVRGESAELDVVIIEGYDGPQP